MNHRMQVQNLAAVTGEVRKWLDRTGNVCVHVRHWGVPLDILVFANETMVNPRIAEEGSVRRNILEVDLAGRERWRQRATSVTVNFWDAQLLPQMRTLWEEQAFCLAHYVIHVENK
jgi:hypothetical protein